MGIWDNDREDHPICPGKPARGINIPEPWFMCKNDVGESCFDVCLLIIYSEDEFVFDGIRRGMIDAPKVLFVGRKEPDARDILKLIKLRAEFSSIPRDSVVMKGEFFGKKVLGKEYSCPVIGVDKLSIYPDKPPMVVGPSRSTRALSTEDTKVLPLVHSEPSEDQKGFEEKVKAFILEKSKTDEKRIEDLEKSSEERAKKIEDSVKSLESNTKKDIRDVVGPLEEKINKILSLIEGKLSEKKIEVTDERSREKIEVFEDYSFPSVPLVAHREISTPVFNTSPPSFPTFPPLYTDPSPPSPFPIFKLPPAPQHAYPPPIVKPPPIFSKDDMFMFVSYSKEQRNALAGRKKNSTKALELIDITIMLGKCLYGRTKHQDPLPVDSITYLQLPWNEYGSRGRPTMIRACDDGYKDMELLGEAMVQIKMTCDGLSYDSARNRKSTNKYGRVVTHQRLREHLQSYYDLCGGGIVSISDDGFLTIL